MKNVSILREIERFSGRDERFHFVLLSDSKTPIKGVSWKQKPSYKEVAQHKGYVGFIPGKTDVLVLDIDQAPGLSCPKKSTPHRCFTSHFLSNDLFKKLKRANVWPLYLNSQSGFPYSHMVLCLYPKIAQSIRDHDLHRNRKIYWGDSCIGDSRMDSGYVVFSSDLPLNFFDAIRGKVQAVRGRRQFGCIKSLLTPPRVQRSMPPPLLPPPTGGRVLTGLNDYNVCPFQGYYRDYLYAWTNGYSSAFIDEKIKFYFDKRFTPQTVERIQKYIKSNHEPWQKSFMA